MSQKNVKNVSLKLNLYIRQFKVYESLCTMSIRKGLRILDGSKSELPSSDCTMLLQYKKRKNIFGAKHCLRPHVFMVFLQTQNNNCLPGIEFGHYEQIRNQFVFKYNGVHKINKSI